MPDGSDDLYRRLGGYQVLSRPPKPEGAPEAGMSAFPDAALLRRASAPTLRSDQAVRIHPLFGVSMERMGLPKILAVVALFAVLLFAAYGILGLLGLGPWGSQ
jgi:hypothetical protein